jgi:hypothetical protein
MDRYQKTIRAAKVSNIATAESNPGTIAKMLAEPFVKAVSQQSST